MTSGTDGSGAVIKELEGRRRRTPPQRRDTAPPAPLTVAEDDDRTGPESASGEATPGAGDANGGEATPGAGNGGSGEATPGAGDANGGEATPGAGNGGSGEKRSPTTSAPGGRGRRREAEPMRVDGSELTTHFGARVRQSLDDVAEDKLHELRRGGKLRSNKVELLEMFLWELADVPPKDLAARLQRFREFAPRQP